MVSLLEAEGRKLENRRDRRTPNRQGFWACLDVGDFRLLVDEVAIGIMLLRIGLANQTDIEISRSRTYYHELAGVEPVIEYLTSQHVLLFELALLPYCT